MDEPDGLRKRGTCCAPDCDERVYQGLDEAAQLFKALAGETRLAIVRQLLEREEMCACEFVACCRVAQPTVSHHLKVLREAGLVRTERRGQWIYYRLARERLVELSRWLP
ncbi:MAG TPA: winged helix-turn-helix transcriptional regulator [Chloroflexi bacterium]|nr:winged helix-turn-helix transcriptional regulator [Chloroflexota bacterium]